MCGSFLNGNYLKNEFTLLFVKKADSFIVSYFNTREEREDTRYRRQQSVSRLEILCVHRQFKDELNCTLPRHLFCELASASLCEQTPAWEQHVCVELLCELALMRILCELDIPTTHLHKRVLDGKDN